MLVKTPEYSFLDKNSTEHSPIFVFVLFNRRNIHGEPFKKNSHKSCTVQKGTTKENLEFDIESDSSSHIKIKLIFLNRNSHYLLPKWKAVKMPHPTVSKVRGLNVI